jgi:hypothetical protein
MLRVVPGYSETSKKNVEILVEDLDEGIEKPKIEYLRKLEL